MALLMLTFKMADVFRKDGIKVNAIQIPAIKLSKETLIKFKSVWRMAASIQNIYSSTPESMADTYFYICTSEECKDITGKLFNDKRELMRPSNYSSGFIQEFKQLTDKGVYPKYADDIANIERVWELAVQLTSK